MARRARGFQGFRAYSPSRRATARASASSPPRRATATPQPPQRVRPRPPLLTHAEQRDPEDEVRREAAASTRRLLDEHQQLERRISSLLLCRHAEYLGVGARGPATRGQQDARRIRLLSPVMGRARGEYEGRSLLPATDALTAELAHLRLGSQGPPARPRAQSVPGARAGWFEITTLHLATAAHTAVRWHVFRDDSTRGHD